jgi:hypothetical protein
VGAKIEAAFDHGLVLAVARETLLLHERQHPAEEQRLRLLRRRDGHHRRAEEHDCKRTAGAATESGNGCHGDNETRPITDPRTVKLEPGFFIRPAASHSLVNPFVPPRIYGSFLKRA